MKDGIFQNVMVFIYLVFSAAISSKAKEIFGVFFDIDSAEEISTVWINFILLLFLYFCILCTSFFLNI